MGFVLIVLLTLLAAIAIVVWWMFDIDFSDVVSCGVAPAIGIAIIYWQGTLLAWAGGLLLLFIGAISIYFVVKRRARPPR